METSFIHMQTVVHLHVNKTSFHTKGFTLGLTLKQRRKAPQKSPIGKVEVGKGTAEVRKMRGKLGGEKKGKAVAGTKKKMKKKEHVRQELLRKYFEKTPLRR